MVGCLAASKAGHDKNEIYLIVREEQDKVFLADGNVRTITNPKRKNKKHIQLIRQGFDKELANQITQQLETGKTVRNEDIKYLIKRYKRQMQ